MSQAAAAALAESVVTSGYPALVLDRLAKQTCSLVESAASAIFAPDRDQPGMAIAVAACGAHSDIVGSRFPARDGFRRAVVGARDGRRRAVHATVAARWKGEVRGALVVGTGTDAAFGMREMDLLGELATTAGAALGHVERRGQALAHVAPRVGTLAEALDAHDAGTGRHSADVVSWSCAVGERMRLGLPDLLELELGARLHDLGKIRVPEGLLRKPAPLDPTERMMMRRHPVWGAEMLETIPGLEPVATIVRFHHERWDGDGYPEGIARERIPLASRIIAVCDAYHAMTSERPYRRALPPAAAASELCSRSGSQFDPVVVQSFVAVLEEAAWGVRT